MLLFKQKVLKDELINYIYFNGAMFIFFVLFDLVCLLTHNNDLSAQEILFIILTSLLSFAIICVGSLTQLEWYSVYEDRIEVRCPFGKKNMVLFNQVKYVEDTKIFIEKGVSKEFYIFNDGRKNNNSFIDHNDCYNKKKFNLRIYKTPEIENLIKEMNFEIKISKK